LIPLLLNDPDIKLIKVDKVLPVVARLVIVVFKVSIGAIPLMLPSTPNSNLF
jgi:hypothetical protein